MKEVLGAPYSATRVIGCTSVQPRAFGHQTVHYLRSNLMPQGGIGQIYIFDIMFLQEEGFPKTIEKESIGTAPITLIHDV